MRIQSSVLPIEQVIESGDIVILLKTGALRNADIVGTLQGLCRGDVPARADSNHITLFKSVGTAIEDLAAAGLAYLQAVS